MQCGSPAKSWAGNMSRQEPMFIGDQQWDLFCPLSTEFAKAEEEFFWSDSVPDDVAVTDAFRMFLAL